MGYDIDGSVTEHELHMGNSEIAEDHSDLEEFQPKRNGPSSRFDDECEEEDDTDSFMMTGPSGKGILYAPPLLSKK